jgi:hypothetical protein
VEKAVDIWELTGANRALYITPLAVDQAASGQGIGRVLMDRTRHKSRSAGYPLLYLICTSIHSIKIARNIFPRYEQHLHSKFVGAQEREGASCVYTTHKQYCLWWNLTLSYNNPGATPAVFSCSRNSIDVCMKIYNLHWYATIIYYCIKLIAKWSRLYKCFSTNFMSLILNFSTNS